MPRLTQKDQAVADALAAQENQFQEDVLEAVRSLEAERRVTTFLLERMNVTTAVVLALKVASGDLAPDKYEIRRNAELEQLLRAVQIIRG